MNRIVRSLSVVFFAAILYLILVEAVSPGLRLPGLGNIGFVLFFVLFSVTHCWAVEGGKRTAVFFAVSAVVTCCMEEMGVATGLVFGPYHYSSQLGVKLGYVPVLVPLGWFMMMYPSRVVAKAMLRDFDTRSIPGMAALSVLAALVMTAWDVVMDPGMSTLGHTWVWEKGGSYFGVPGQNYLGWLVTTFAVYGLTGWLWRGGEAKGGSTRAYTALPVIVYAFFTVRYIATNGFPALQVVAVFSMGIPALLALLQVGSHGGAGETAAISAGTGERRGVSLVG